MGNRALSNLTQGVDCEMATASEILAAGLKRITKATDRRSILLVQLGAVCGNEGFGYRCSAVAAEAGKCACLINAIAMSSSCYCATIPEAPRAGLGSTSAPVQQRYAR